MFSAGPIKTNTKNRSDLVASWSVTNYISIVSVSLARERPFLTWRAKKVIFQEMTVKFLWGFVFMNDVFGKESV